MTAYEQRSYPGAAADTLLSADLAAGGTSFSVTPGTGGGYPDGSQGPFFVIIDWDNSKAEKIRCSARVVDAFTVAGTGGGRGQDGTSVQGHTTNAKVRAVITATDIQEANRAAANTVGLVQAKGDLLSGSGANALTRTAAGADGTVVVFDSTQPGGIRATSSLALGSTSSLGGVSGTTLAGERGAWTSTAVTLVNVTGGSATMRYLVVGKTVSYSVWVTAGTIASGAADVTFLLPNSWAARGTQNVISNLVPTRQLLAGSAASFVMTLAYGGQLATGASVAGLASTGLFELV